MYDKCIVVECQTPHSILWRHKNVGGANKPSQIEMGAGLTLASFK